MYTNLLLVAIVLAIIVLVALVRNSIDDHKAHNNLKHNGNRGRMNNKAMYLHKDQCPCCKDVYNEYYMDHPRREKGYKITTEKDPVQGNYVFVSLVTCYDCSFTIEEIAYHKDVAVGIQS